jgi:hypothetical protein
MRVFGQHSLFGQDIDRFQHRHTHRYRDPLAQDDPFAGAMTTPAQPVFKGEY